MKIGEQRKNEDKEWGPVWQMVANCNKKTMSIIFFEDDKLSFNFSF